MQSGNYPLSRKDNIVIQELRGEILVYDLFRNKAYCLNQTSAMIWQECDGTKSVAEISQKISKSIKSNVSEDIVWLAINQFKTDNLLEKSNDLATPFDGLTRREAVRRIGFASMVALPVISALVAPTALYAQSGGQCFAADNTGDNSAPGCPCIGTRDCCGLCNGAICIPSIGVNGTRPAGGGDPGAAPVCFGQNSSCFGAGQSAGNSIPGCPCTGNVDCCGICTAGQCTPAATANGLRDPGFAPSCPNPNF